ncbi:hypothetical protein RSP03_44930 [Cereibacter sphaeroides]|nr:hypothetical protein RSP03_44930 [Cereibacter sphaeroides]
MRKRAACSMFGSGIESRRGRWPALGGGLLESLCGAPVVALGAGVWCPRIKADDLAGTNIPDAR